MYYCSIHTAEPTGATPAAAGVTRPCTHIRIHICQHLVHLDSSGPPEVSSDYWAHIWIPRLCSVCACQCVRVYPRTYPHTHTGSILTSLTLSENAPLLPHDACLFLTLSLSLSLNPTHTIATKLLITRAVALCHTHICTHTHSNTHTRLKRWRSLGGIIASLRRSWFGEVSKSRGNKNTQNSRRGISTCHFSSYLNHVL